MNSKPENSTSCEIISDGKKEEEATALQKPDKIIQCPRCNSMDTKFCYYNNYNVNQPRHFCKNCQRYWTSGGTMRNVPVGSGRRKNKNTLLPNYPHIMVPDALHADASMKANAFLISSPGFPVSFFPATLFWGAAAPGPPAASADPQALSMSSGSVLGKHSRVGKENLDAVLIPKAMRIHDPSEAAKSCKWSTLGMKNEKLGLFKAFESKGDRQSNVDSRAMVLQANPAALCRSLNFHEST